MSDAEIKKIADEYTATKYDEEIGRKLKICRKKCRPFISQVKMAGYLKTERQHIIKIESGKVRVTIGELLVYCKICEIDISVLVNSSEEYLINYMKTMAVLGQL